MIDVMMSLYRSCPIGDLLDRDEKTLGCKRRLPFLLLYANVFALHESCIKISFHISLTARTQLIPSEAVYVNVSKSAGKEHPDVTDPRKIYSS